MTKICYILSLLILSFNIGRAQGKSNSGDYKVLIATADSLSIARQYFNSNNVAFEAIKIINNYSIEDFEALCNSYSIIANNYLGAGVYEKAIEYCNYGINYSAKYSNDKRLAMFYSDKSIAQFLLGQYNESINNVRLSIEHNRKINNEEGIANSQNTMGKIYEMWKEYDNAIESYEESLKYYKKINDLPRIAVRLSGIASAYRLKGDLDNALKYQTQALEIELRLKNKYKIAVRYDLLGEIYLDKKKYIIAENYFSDALKILKESEKESGENSQITLSECIILNHLGKISYINNKTEESINYYNKSFDIAKRIKYHLMLLKSSKELSDIYAKTGNDKKAYEFLKIFNEAKEKYFDEQSQKNLAEFEKKYEAEKKDNEIAILQKNNQLTAISLKQAAQGRIIFILISILLLLISLIIYLKFYYKKVNNSKLEQKNIELEELNKQKDKFFSIIAHDLRSPISSFQMITESLDNSFETIDKESLKYFIKSMKDAAIDLNIFLKNLLEWAMANLGKLKTTKVVFDINSELDKIITFNSNLAQERKIVFEKRYTNDIKAYADIEMFKTAFRNLLTNSLKYGDVKSTVFISTTFDDINSIISIKNKCHNGACVEGVEKLFKHKNNSNNETNQVFIGSKGMGLDIANELIKLNNGSIIVESATSDNITFSILLPYKN